MDSPGDIVPQRFKRHYNGFGLLTIQKRRQPREDFMINNLSSELREELARIHDRVKKFYDELDGESARAAAILAAAGTDKALGDAIETKFVKLSPKIYSDIFKNYGPLSSFSARIDIAYALGFYGKKTRKRLHSARRVRNDFAHASDPIDFTDHEISKRCRKMTPKNLSDPNNLRERYIGFLREIADHVEWLAFAPELPEGFNKAPLP